tara:strand:+ start:132 stop:353 length:222 start_codon:yes stop_codon:yes gene_type:complete
VATNIQESLAGGLSVTAKPVAMEQLPDATIDVSGGSLSLGIEGLGVKRKKKRSFCCYIFYISDCYAEFVWRSS